MWHIMQVLTYSYILATLSLLVMQENSATPFSLQDLKFWEKSKEDDISQNNGEEKKTPLEWNGNVEELEEDKTKMDSQDESDDSTESSHIYRMLGLALFGNRSPKSEISARPISKQGWGTHPIGTQEDFILDSSSSHLKWVAYFYDQAVAAVLHDENGTMIKCTVQENRQKWEQELALEFLGDLMPLVPLQFNPMVHLVTLCGTLNVPKNIPSPSHPDTLGSWLFDSSTLQGILPGTLWCGVRDRAKHFGELGPRYELDSCCRSHDYCPIKVLGWSTRYGVPNLNFRAILHCSCELEFFRCLKATKNPTSDLVGNIYFNYLEADCLDAPSKRRSRRSSFKASSSSNSTNKSLQLREFSESNLEGNHEEEERRNLWYFSEYGRLDCVRLDDKGGCRKWSLTPEDFSVHLAARNLKLVY